MAVRYYLAPIIQHPSRASLNISRCQLYVGAEVGQQNVIGELSVKGWCVTRVEAPDADAVWAQLDADGLLTRIPVTLLDTPVSDLTQAQRDAVAQEMAARNIPYDWVTAGTTLRNIIGWVIRLLRLTRLLRANFPNVSLDQTWGTIPAAVRNHVLTFAANNGISTAGLNTNSTIRQILRRIIEQYPWPPQGLGPDIF